MDIIRKNFGEMDIFCGKNFGETDILK